METENTFEFTNGIVAETKGNFTNPADKKDIGQAAEVWLNDTIAGFGTTTENTEEYEVTIQVKYKHYNS